MNAVTRDRTPAFEDPLSMVRLRSNPGPIAARLSDLIRSVVVVEVQVGGQKPHAVPHTRYTSFVIDANGETHDLETGLNADEIAANAAWAAQLFSVPLRNESSGQAPTSWPIEPDDDDEAAAFERSLVRRRWAKAATALSIASALGAGSWALSHQRQAQYEEELAAYQAHRRSSDELLSRAFERALQAERTGTELEPTEENLAAQDAVLELVFPTEPPALEPSLPIGFGFFCAGLFGVAGIAMLRRR